MEDYKKVLEGARKYYNDSQTTDQTKETLVNIFPELKEGEDERISREITEFLVDFNNGEYEKPNENTIDSWLAWLEKQGKKASDKIVEKARTEKQRVLLTETNGDANIDWDTRSIQDAKLLLEYGLDYIKNKFMKANAPEKLYVDVQDNLDDSFLYGFRKKSGDEDVEYTRTDAFIEKACEWLEPVLKNYAGYYAGTDALEDFRNYMKGE